MPSIADSSAVKIDGGQLPQHQSALTLLQGRLASPAIKTMTWHDLACGRGQILEGLGDSLSEIERSKISFSAYDVDQDYARETRRSASSLGFAEIGVFIGDLMQFDQVLPDAEKFDFITLTNTVHEVAPEGLARLLANSICRLADEGILFVYDMERIVPPELGALPWTGLDIRVIANQLTAALGAPEYQPGVGCWHHRSVDGWNLQFDRRNIALSDTELRKRLPGAISATGEAIRSLMVGV